MQGAVVLVSGCHPVYSETAMSQMAGSDRVTATRGQRPARGGELLPGVIGAAAGMNGPAVLSRSGLDGLIAALIADGYRVIGPTVRDDAIVLAEIGSGAELPTVRRSASWSLRGGRRRLRAGPVHSRGRIFARPDPGRTC